MFCCVSVMCGTFGATLSRFCRLFGVFGTPLVFCLYGETRRWGKGVPLVEPRLLPRRVSLKRDVPFPLVLGPPEVVGTSWVSEVVSVETQSVTPRRVTSLYESQV